MIRRLLNLAESNSFFLFGPRGCGKTTLIHEIFKNKNAFWIDFLNLDFELRYKQRPQLLVDEYMASAKKPEWIIIDEVQKVPSILDAVQQLIEKYKVKFVLTGSSARKLKRSQANMLAGRAFNFSLFSFSYLELKEQFDLLQVLQFGSLPKLYNKELYNEQDKIRYLKSYVSTYLKEEIIVEQLVRQIEPFHRFLEVAAQSNREIINYSKLAKEAQITDKSVARYFEILSDTLMGHLIPAYHKSIRKQQIESPKFYFFDTGIVRAIRGELNYPLKPKSYEYGNYFESFIVNEIIKQNIYLEKDYKISYLKTKEGQEIDLIVESRLKTFLIEIKSCEVLDSSEVKALITLLPSFKKAAGLVLCTNNNPNMLTKEIKAIHWQDGIREIFN